ncbi:MAG: hypothetical protein IJJ71_13720 [Treponema sp.]|uniref:hypothetical protein n=1 Tax=Treponema sp. TaxID=166 RepID=UPI0025D8F657|nr:hypothetical protein [Treponema sp.]MBR0497216.1 hypothetical protein [Treponema sp.]
MIEKQDCKRLFFIILSVLLLFAGGMIYLNFRLHTLQMFSWLKFIGAENLFRQKEFKNDSEFLSFLIFSIPNGLWSLSAIILFGEIWRESKKSFLFYTVLFSSANILFEILQLFRWISGTFDYLDILVLLISVILGILIYKYFIWRNSYES